MIRPHDWRLTEGPGAHHRCARCGRACYVPPHLVETPCPGPRVLSAADLHLLPTNTQARRCLAHPFLVVPAKE